MYSSCIHFGVPKFGKPPQWVWQQCVIESQPPSPARGSPSVLQVITRDILEAVRCTMTAGSAISHCNIHNIQENWGLSTQLISCSASKVCGFGLSKPLHFFKILVAYHLQLNHSNICSPLTYQRFSRGLLYICRNSAVQLRTLQCLDTFSVFFPQHLKLFT